MIQAKLERCKATRNCLLIGRVYAEFERRELQQGFLVASASGTAP